MSELGYLKHITWFTCGCLELCVIEYNVRNQNYQGTKSVMSNRNCLLSQKVRRYLNQGRTLNDVLMRAAHWMT